MAVRYESSHVEDRQANLKRLQEKFGARPGNYRVDPWYFRFGIANKPYWWDDYDRRWRMLKFGDEFDWDENGIMIKVNDD